MSRVLHEENQADPEPKSCFGSRGFIAWESIWPV